MTTTPRPRPSARPLADLLLRVDAVVRGDAQTAVTGVTHDSREVRAGDLYAALPGLRAHGADFAAQAVAGGAVAVLTDADGARRAGDPGVPVLVVDDPRDATGRAAAWAYGDPGESLLTIGVTGTNGKTTTASLITAGLASAGHPSGLIGTLGTFVGDARIPTARTTPESTDLQAILAVMVERGVTAVAMEVSSHALALHRVSGLVFDVAAFTNLSQDHLDFHGTMEEYFRAKASLFTPRLSRRGVVTIDDAWGRRLADTSGVAIETVATDGSLADWQLMGAERLADGRTAVEVRLPDGRAVVVPSHLPGRFNLANTTLALAALHAAGVPVDAAVAGLAGSAGVPGRMERVAADGLDIFVDYAHSPDAIDRVIGTARELLADGPGRVIVVIGGGGDRDRDKRPLMGRAAAAADVVVITDDNPRTEDPAAIRASILAGAREGVAQVVEEPDRAEAIARALRLAAPGDCVLLLGKGHETGQEVAGVVTPFDDRVVAAEALRSIGEGGR